MSKVKITVVKKVANQDLIRQFAAPEFQQKSAHGCDRFEVGQVFETTWNEVPAGFCTWAWADIQRDIVAMQMGGDAPWIVPKGTMITCCTDGFRPVVFKVERIPG